MNKKTERVILFLYLAGFLTLACTVLFLQPLMDTPPLFGNPPDEHARFLIPWYIYQHGRIPTGFEEEIRVPAYGFSYGLYNVFPYIVQGYVMRFAGLFTKSQQALLYVARSVNLLSGLCMAWIVYLISRRIFSDRRFGWAFCFAVTYLPENLFMHTYVNTDSMCLLSVAMMVYALVCAYREGFTGKNCAWLCAGIILCALSYYNAYGYILSCILLFFAYFFEKKDGKWRLDWKNLIRKGALICVVVLAGISWWFIRSYLLYDGDFLGLATREKMSVLYGAPAVNPANHVTYRDRGYTVFQMMRETDFLEGAFYSLVASFGSMTIFGNIWLYRAYKIFFGLGAAGCLLHLIFGKADPSGKIYVRKAGSSWYPAGEGERWKNLFFHGNMVFCAAMPLILLIRYAYVTDFQNQGRYLLPALIPLMYYAVRGLMALTSFKHCPAFLSGLLPVLAAALPIASAIHMVYFAAMPVYLQ